MEISWLGHSCFKLKSAQATIVTDPYSPELGYSLDGASAQIVTVSHSHPGHSYVQGVAGNPKVISGPGEYEVSGVLIVGMKTYHDDTEGKTRGKNTVYLFTMDEMVICHLGDIGHLLTSEQIADIEIVDVLLLPVGGISTIDASVSAKIVRQLEPKIVIPMHYKTDVIKRELDPVDRFIKEMGAKEITPQPKLLVTKGNLPPGGTRVVLLSY